VKRYALALLALALASVRTFACEIGEERTVPALTLDNRFNLVAVTDMGFKGRAQDENVKPWSIGKEIYKDPKASVPKLIASLTDERTTKDPVLCPIYSYSTASDVAFMILSDMFLDSSWKKSTVPGTSVQELIGHSDEPFLIQLHTYTRKHGRSSLQRKWQTIWKAYEGKVEWDAKERCFVMKKPPEEAHK